jgi:hypothetical protein
MDRPLGLTFLKDRYDYELARRDGLTSSLTLPAGILTGLGGLLALMLRSFSYESAVLAVLFVFSLALAVLAFMVCLFFLARAWHSGEYE